MQDPKIFLHWGISLTEGSRVNMQNPFLTMGCVYPIPELPVLPANDQNIWCKNFASKGEQRQLRRKTTQHTRTDIWCLKKHPPNLICRRRVGKLFDFWECGQKGGKGRKEEEM